jgi:hypothetical protein
MDLSKLNDDQIKVTLKIIESAKKYGINPEFVLAMVSTESEFKQDALSPRGAIGVMQLLPETAKSLKVDPTNIDQNIDGGMRLIKELTEDKRIGNDPFRLLVGYNASSATRKKFFESDNTADLPDETVMHVIKIMKPFGVNFPSISFTPGAQPQEASDTQDDQESDSQYGGDVVTDGGSDEETQAAKGRSAKEMGVVGAALGTGAGSIYTAKMPLVRLASRVGLLPGGKPMSPEDAAKMVGSVMSQDGQTPGGKWAAKTGYGMGEGTVQESSSRYQRAMPQGKISGRLAKRFGPATPGESPQLAQRLIDRSNMAEATQRAQTALQSAQQGTQPDAVQRAARGFFGAAPVRGALAGLGVGYNVQDAYNKFQEGDTLSGALASNAALASGLGLVPKIAPVMNPLAVGLTTASQVASDIRRGDKQSAAESGLTGLTALLPRLFGPLSGLVYSGGLNKGEEEELARRRQMAPTISP